MFASVYPLLGRVMQRNWFIEIGHFISKSDILLTNAVRQPKNAVPDLKNGGNQLINAENLLINDKYEGINGKNEARNARDELRNGKSEVINAVPGLINAENALIIADYEDIFTVCESGFSWIEVLRRWSGTPSCGSPIVWWGPIRKRLE